MSDSNSHLQRKMSSASDLLGVVRTMKGMAASNIHQYQQAVNALDDYYSTVQLGLTACFRQTNVQLHAGATLFDLQQKPANIGVVALGSDQGLVGQFNDSLAEFMLTELAGQASEISLWVVGERLQSSLAQSALALNSHFLLPNSLHTITPFVGELLLMLEGRHAAGEIGNVFIFHNRPNHQQDTSASIYTPVKQRLLPLDKQWRHDITAITWPSPNLPELVHLPEQIDHGDTLLALIHEYLFVSLYRACAESMASENAARLAAMQRAEKNIEELLSTMSGRFHQLRQSGIDEELFDVIAGFNALGAGKAGD